MGQLLVFGSETPDGGLQTQYGRGGQQAPDDAYALIPVLLF